MKKRKFDVIVIGAGSGLNISSVASQLGLKVAVVEKGPMGGTCLNRGCIPSKILIHRADIAEIISRAQEFGIKAGKFKIDFSYMIKDTFKVIDSDSKNIESGIKSDKNMKLFKGEGKFISKKTLKVNNDVISGDKIFIVAGTRPTIPKIKGLEKVDYLTSDEVMRLSKLPKSITFIGGGYIACELAHFFGSLGSKVNIIQRNRLLVPDEDGEIAEKFTKIFSKKYNVLLEHQTIEISKKGKNILLKVQRKDGKGPLKKIETEKLVIATGRIPNTDILDVKKTGVTFNEFGFIEVNDYLETNVDGIWALGDIIGKYMFKHSANLEAQYAVNNAFGKSKSKVDYKAMPHAVFSSPQVAGVGLTEEQLKEKNIQYKVGKYDYIDTGMGLALKDREGFAKILVHKNSGEILGCHIMGTDASTLIHEVIVAMKSGKGTIDNITKAVHVHPALSEVVQRAGLKVK